MDMQWEKLRQRLAAFEAHADLTLDFQMPQQQLTLTLPIK